MNIQPLTIIRNLNSWMLGGVLHPVRSLLWTFALLLCWALLSAETVSNAAHLVSNAVVSTATSRGSYYVVSLGSVSYYNALSQYGGNSGINTTIFNYTSVSFSLIPSKNVPVSSRLSLEISGGSQAASTAVSTAVSVMSISFQLSGGYVSLSQGTSTGLSMNSAGGSYSQLLSGKVSGSSHTSPSLTVSATQSSFEGSGTASGVGVSSGSVASPLPTCSPTTGPSAMYYTSLVSNAVSDSNSYSALRSNSIVSSPSLPTSGVSNIGVSGTSSSVAAGSVLSGSIASGSVAYGSVISSSSARFSTSLVSVRSSTSKKLTSLPYSDLVSASHVSSPYTSQVSSPASSNPMSKIASFARSHVTSNTVSSSSVSLASISKASQASVATSTQSTGRLSFVSYSTVMSQFSQQYSSTTSTASFMCTSMNMMSSHKMSSHTISTASLTGSATSTSPTSGVSSHQFLQSISKSSFGYSNEQMSSGASLQASQSTYVYSASQGSGRMSLGTSVTDGSSSLNSQKSSSIGNSQPSISASPASAPTSVLSVGSGFIGSLSVRSVPIVQSTVSAVLLSSTIFSLKSLSLVSIGSSSSSIAASSLSLRTSSTNTSGSKSMPFTSSTTGSVSAGTPSTSGQTSTQVFSKVFMSLSLKGLSVTHSAKSTAALSFTSSVSAAPFSASVSIATSANPISVTYAVSGAVVSGAVSHIEPTKYPTRTPSARPTKRPTRQPTAHPTVVPTVKPTKKPTAYPTVVPSTAAPTTIPSSMPTVGPTPVPSADPTAAPTVEPTACPTASPTAAPSAAPTVEPTASPTAYPTAVPSPGPTALPSVDPTASPTVDPSPQPTAMPSTAAPTTVPTTATPSTEPTSGPTAKPSTATPSSEPTTAPSAQPTTALPSATPTTGPTTEPSFRPTAFKSPTALPSAAPTTPPSPSPTAIPTYSLKELWTLKTKKVLKLAHFANISSNSVLYYETVVQNSYLFGGCKGWNSFFSTLTLKSIYQDPVSIDIFTYTDYSLSSSTNANATCATESSATSILSNMISSYQQPTSSSVSAFSCTDGTNSKTNKWNVGSCSLFPVLSVGSSTGSAVSQLTLSACNTNCSGFANTASLSKRSILNSAGVMRLVVATFRDIKPAPTVESITAVTIASLAVTVNVTLDSDGLVYCAAFLPSAGVPASVAAISSQNHLRWSYSNISSILLNGLKPSTAYNVYCATVSADNVQSSLSAVQSTYLAITTACCRTVTATLNTASVRLGASLIGAISVSLSANPDVTLTLTPKVAGSSLSGLFYPTNHTFTSTSLLSTTFSVVQSTANRLSLGNYKIDFVLSGSSSSQYSVSYSKGSNISVISAAAEPPTPKLASATMSNDGTSALIQFSAATNLGGSKIGLSKFSCSQLLRFNYSGGTSVSSTGVSCQWGQETESLLFCFSCEYLRFLVLCGLYRNSVVVPIEPYHATSANVRSINAGCL
jgi:hypothetical protein